jgi:autotransporter-associated beta strand protein
MYQSSKVRAVLGLILLAAGMSSAWATVFTNKVNSANWSDPLMWKPTGGPPLAADTAVFDGYGIFNIATGNQSADTVRAIGASNVDWNQTANTLTVGSLFCFSNSAVGNFNARLAGGGALQVDAGTLKLNNALNSFSGGITINRGWLHSSVAGGLGSGAQTITLGSANPGNDAATLQLPGADAATFANPIVVRAGNDGPATISCVDYSPQMTGPVTLNKRLILEEVKYWINRYNLYFSNFTLRFEGPIGGTGGITKVGKGQVMLTQTANANTYTGDTIVAGGWLLLPATSSTVVGDLRVQHGLAMVRSNATLGASSNRILLGTPGTFGALGAWPSVGGGTVAFTNRVFQLEGNGGILIGHGSYGNFNNGSPSLDCVVSGPGRLLVGSFATAYLNNNNLHTGGTIVYDGTTDISGAGNTNKNVYGPGDVVVERLGSLSLRGTNNIAATAKALVHGRLALYADTVPNLDTNSSGALRLDVDSGININARLAVTAPPLGNGKMTLVGNSKTFNGTSLQAGIDGIYRLAGEATGYTLTLNSPTTAGVLTGTNSVHALGNIVSLADANTYEGETRVWSGTLQGTAQTAGSPFGATNGSVLVSYAAWKLSGASGGAAVKKGALTFDSIGIVQVDKTGGAGFLTTLEVDSLVRSNKAVLAIQGMQNSLGTNEQFKVTSGAPTPVNNMVDPYYVDYGGYFLTYGVNGFARATWSKTSFATAGSTDYVNLTLAEAPASPVTVHALRTGVNVTGANKVTLGSGGLILAGGTHTAPFEFPGEGVVFCSADSALNGPLTAPNGFIKAGGSILTLGTDNSGTLAGTITVDQGELRITNDNQLGSATVRLNGGSLLTTANITVDNNIELGPRGGTVKPSAPGYNAYSNNISGVGALTANATTLSGLNNTYSGGTIVDSAGLTVTATSSLGMGPVTVISYGYLTLKGNANLASDQPVYMNSAGATIHFWGDRPACGTPSGDGNIVLGIDNVTTYLTVGLDNRDADFYGWIVEFQRAPQNVQRIIKAGTGTWTLWGENIYGGGTTVSNGTLVVNNWLNPTGGVVVCAGATLDGIGTVGIVSNQGGTVKGSLYMRQLVMAAGSTNAVTLNGTNAVSQYGQLNVTEGVTLTDSVLDLKLGFAPAVGQSFTILNNTGSLTGQFTCGDRITAATSDGRTYFFRVDYAGGNVVLTRLVTGTIMTIR